MTYINAVGISSGGGLRLLEALVEMCSGCNDFFFYLDYRFPDDFLEKVDIRFEKINISEKGRFKFAKELKHKIEKNDVLFCFNNLPPLVKMRGEVIVFVQNRQILEPFSQKNLSFKERARLVIQYLLLKKNFSKADQYFVQTPSMKRVLGGGDRVSIVPFLPKLPVIKKSKSSKKSPKEHIFFFPSDSLAHKNHDHLIEAWEMLSREGKDPTLVLTINKHQLSMRAQSKIDENGLKVTFKGVLSYEEIFQCYAQADAMIFPSLCESFGLPMLEAEKAELPILASDRDFVHDVVSSVRIFNPNDPLSIKREVLSFLESEERPAPKSKVEHIDILSLLKK